MARMVELAKTHPVVATWTTSPVSAAQGEFILSVGLSLLGGKVFKAGMTTVNVASSLVGCWWRPVGSGWRPCDIQFARRVWLDLCEGDWTGVVGSSTCDDVLEEDADSAAAGAASGAPEGREKKIADSNSPPRGASESEAEKVQAESERFGPDAEEEDSPGAASGALVPYGLGGTSADDLARASDLGRQVHFNNATTWPIRNMGSRPCSSKKLKQRREGVLALVAALMRDGCPVPTNPSEFHRALPRLLSRSEKSRDELFDVPRALWTQKQRFFLRKLQDKFQGESFHSQRFFCEGFPSLEPPAPGGDQIVESVSYRHPMCEALLRRWGVNTVPDFLKQVCSQHHGEVRLLPQGWVPVAQGVDVRHPAFWTPQFVKEGASRRWLAQRDPGMWLEWHEVHSLFQDNDGETTVLRKCTAASGATSFAIRQGTAVTLVQMYYHGEELCTAFDIYNAYIQLPILIHKVRHSTRGVRSVGRAGLETGDLPLAVA